MQPNISLKEPIEGYLQKFTNLMKGYQYRWFVLNPSTGMLEYYLTEQEFRDKQKPRNAIYLGEANVIPIEEDLFTFILNSGNGEMFKIKAIDGKERQFWISQIRSLIEYHHNADKISSTSSMNLNATSLKPQSSNTSADFFNNLFSFDILLGNSTLPVTKKISNQKSNILIPSITSGNALENESQIKAAKEVLRLSEKHYKDVKDIIENIPSNDEPKALALHHRNKTLTNTQDLLNEKHNNENSCNNLKNNTQADINLQGSLDPDLLLLKATGLSTLNSLQTCLNALEFQYSCQFASTSTNPTSSRVTPLLTVSPSESFINNSKTESSISLPLPSK